MKTKFLSFLGITCASLLLTGEKASSQAFAAKQLTLNGHNLYSDSYDSASQDRSTDGAYDPLKAGDQGNVATEAGFLNSIGAANVFIWGKLSTGPAPVFDIGPESSIGSAAWHQSGQQGVEPGFSDANFRFQFPDAILPFVVWSSPEGGTWEGEVYTYILGDGNFRVSSLDLSGSERILVRGSACLCVTNELNLKGNAAIRILPSASLKLYVGAATANIRGTGILNEGLPSHFIYYALAANSTINLRLTTAFSGLIYAPRGVCYLSTKGNVTADWSGAFVVQELDLGTPLRLHYDEALSR